MFGEGVSPVHIAFRGTPNADSIRCEWHGVARTLTQREEVLRFLLGIGDDEPLPSVADMEQYFASTIEQLIPRVREGWRTFAAALIGDGLTTNYLILACYADYSVSEYLLGNGPNKLTVAYDAPLAQPLLSYNVYLKTHQEGGYEGDP